MKLYTSFITFLLAILLLNKKLCSCLREQSSLATTFQDTITPQSLIPLWKRNIWMNLYIFINNKSIFNDYKATPDWEYHLQNNEEQDYTKHINIQQTQHNTNVAPPLYAHIFLVKDSFPIDPTNKSFSLDSIVYVCHGLTKYYEDNQPYWHDTITISLVHDTNGYISKDTLHPVTLAYFLNNQKGGYGVNKHVGFYRPIVFPNDCWLIKKDARLMNDTTSLLPLTIHLETINLWKFNVYAVLAAEKSQDNNVIQHSIDETKRMMLNSNPSFMLSFTLLTCLLHGLFEFLAFKHDVSFWMNKKNRIGVSINSIIINIILQIILFIYFMDSDHILRTSGQIASICIEVWKIHTLLGYYWTFIQNKMQFTIKLVRVQHHNTLQQKGERITNDLDATALHCMIYTLIPAYMVCKIFYQYSFIDFLHTFGYLIVVAPQLYINHSMNIVNHVSFNTIFYKIVNIGIDDVFAFTIGMPITQRLSCTKYNIIFLIYYLQKTRFTNTLFNQLKSMRNKK